MKEFFLRIEHLLWLTPILLFVLSFLFVGNSAIDIHLHDTYIVLNDGGVAILFIWLCIIIIPLIIHFLLRYYHRRNSLICTFHVIITVALMILLSSLVAYQGSVLMKPRRYYKYNVDFANSLTATENGTMLMLLLLLTVQTLFILHALMGFIQRGIQNTKYK